MNSRFEIVLNKFAEYLSGFVGTERTFYFSCIAVLNKRGDDLVGFGSSGEVFTHIPCFLNCEFQALKRPSAETLVSEELNA